MWLKFPTPDRVAITLRSGQNYFAIFIIVLSVSQSLDATEDSSEYDYSPVFLNGEFHVAKATSRARLLIRSVAEKINKYFRPLPVGEIEAARATNVNLYIAQKIKAQSKKKKAPPNQKRVGLLIITNFRLCFVVYEEHNKTDKSNSNKVSSHFHCRHMISSHASCLSLFFLL